MENENKILKEIQQSNRAVLSMLATQNKNYSAQFDSLRGDLSHFMKMTMDRFERIDEKFEHIDETLERMEQRFVRVEQATLENRGDIQGLNANFTRIAHNHEIRITRIEKHIAA